jgi:hypothetical protein
MRVTSFRLIIGHLTDCQQPHGISKLYDRKSDLLYTTAFNDHLIQIDSKISLSNIIHIEHQGNISVKEFWLGGVKASQEMLDQIFIYSPAHSSSTIVSKNWQLPGITKIELFSLSPIHYHLLYQNNFKF